MKNLGKCYAQSLVWWIGIAVLFVFAGCVPTAVPTGGVTSVPLAMRATDSDLTATVDAGDAMKTIVAALTQSPATSTVAEAEMQTQTAIAGAAETATQAAINATQTSEAQPPTATPTPTPDLAATAAQLANEQATAIAGTITALAPSPTATPTATPNLDATAQEQATEQAAIAATLTALAPTITATPTPDLDATRAEDDHQMETAVAATLTEVARRFTPTPIPTATPRPPTNTPLPPPPVDTPVPPPPRPTNTPQPPNTSGFFHGSVNPDCTGDRNMTWFEGMVYINGQPANGYKIVFKSYLVPGDQPATSPAISGPHDGYPDWANGYYAHIVNDHFEKKHLEVWVINDGGQAISDRVRWNSDGAEGSCNKATINFAQ